MSNRKFGITTEEGERFMRRENELKRAKRDKREKAEQELVRKLQREIEQEGQATQ